MKSILIALCLAFLVPVQAHAAEAALSEADQAAIRAAALDYAQGWYLGEAERMARALHPKLAKRAYLPNKEGQRELHEMDRDALLAGNKPQNRQRYADAAQQADVLILDGFGHAASVKLTMDGWVDYMHLSRTPAGDWQVINVLWELKSH